MKDYYIKVLKPEAKPAILAALYNASKPLGLGFLHYDPAPMTVEEATEIMANGSTIDYAKPQVDYFDYLKDRVMKISLKGDVIRPELYDRDNGFGAARKAVEDLEGVEIVEEADV